MSQPGPVVSYYKRLESVVDAPAREASFFDGIDDTIPGIYRALRKPAPSGADAALQAIDRAVASAVQSFRMIDPSAAAPALARALAATREAQRQLGGDPDVAFLLTVKEEQLQAAITAALGVTFTAVAQPAATRAPNGEGAAYAPPVPMTPVVRGQSFEVRTTFVNRGPIDVTGVQVTLAGWGGRSTGGQESGTSSGRGNGNAPLSTTFSITVPPDAPLTRPYFTRRSIQETRYVVADPSAADRPQAEPALTAVATFEVNGVPVEVREPVTRLESNAPYGYDVRVLAVLPATSVTLTPGHVVVPLGTPDKQVRVRAEVLNNLEGNSAGTVTLKVPPGWIVEPPSASFQFSRAGERTFYPFTVTIPALENREYPIEATATTEAGVFREGYDIIQHRDLETRTCFATLSRAFVAST